MAKGDIVPIIERGTLLVDTGNRKVTAVFRPASTLNVTAGEGGTVSASTAPINSNMNNAQQITATAADGYWFDHWELDNNTVSQEEGITNALNGSNSVIDADALHVGTGDGHTLQAVFKRETNFAVEANEGGFVSVSTSARTKDGYNKTAITAKAGPGYVFKGWFLDDEPILGGAQIDNSADGSTSTIRAKTLQIGTEEGHIVKAVFAQEYTLTISVFRYKLLWRIRVCRLGAGSVKWKGLSVI